LFISPTAIFVSVTPPISRVSVGPPTLTSPVYVTEKIYPQTGLVSAPPLRPGRRLAKDAA
jgi:hypothetical protein